VIGVALGEALSRLQVRLFLDQSHLRGSPTLGERARVKRGLWSNAFLDTLRPGRRQLIQQGTGRAKEVPFLGFWKGFSRIFGGKTAFLKTLHSKKNLYQIVVKTLFLYLNVLKTGSNFGSHVVITWLSSQGQNLK